MLSVVYDQRNESAPLFIMSSNLQTWLDIHWSNPFSWIIIAIAYPTYSLYNIEHSSSFFICSL